MKNLLFFAVLLMVSVVVFSEDSSANSESKVLHPETSSRNVRHIGASGYLYGYMPHYTVGYYPPQTYHVQPLGVVPVSIPVYGSGKRHKSKVSIPSDFFNIDD